MEDSLPDMCERYWTLCLADLTDDVDTSISSIRARGREMRELEAAIGDRADQIHTAAGTYAACVIRCYASGAPFSWEPGPATQSAIVVILHTGDIDEQMALIVNRRHVLTSGEGGGIIDDTETFFEQIGQVLGIQFQVRLEEINPADFGLNEGSLPDQWDALAQAWLDRSGICA